MTLVPLVVLVALMFEYFNGFHNTANPLATLVSTKVFTPRQAISPAAFTNLVGALRARTPVAGASSARWGRRW